MTDPTATWLPIERRTRRGEAQVAFVAMLNQQTDDCVLWPFSKTSWGYGHLQVDGKMRQVHRLACEHLHGPPPTDLHQAAHTCGVRLCVNSRHLRWATRKENEADKVKHGTAGRQPRGEKCLMAKLTASQVTEIRNRYGDGGHTHRSLASEYGVAHCTVGFIIRGESWTSIQGPAS